MRKKEMELELSWLGWCRHYSDGASSPELSKGDRKSRAKKGRTATTSELYRAAKRARRRHIVAFSTPVQNQGRPQAHLEPSRRTPAVGRWSWHCSTYL